MRIFQDMGFAQKVSQHHTLHFRSFLAKTNDYILRKCPKSPFSPIFGPFSPYFRAFDLITAEPRCFPSHKQCCMVLHVNGLCIYVGASLFFEKKYSGSKSALSGFGHIWRKSGHPIGQTTPQKYFSYVPIMVLYHHTKKS